MNGPHYIVGGDALTSVSDSTQIVIKFRSETGDARMITTIGTLKRFKEDKAMVYCEPRTGQAFSFFDIREVWYQE